MPKHRDSPSFLAPHLLLNFTRRKELRCPECGDRLYFEDEQLKAGWTQHTAICERGSCPWTQSVEFERSASVLRSTPPGHKLIFPLGGPAPKPKKQGPPKQEPKWRNSKWKGVVCAASPCRRHAKVKSLCHWHYRRWRQCGQPDLQEWVRLSAPARKRWMTHRADLAAQIEEATRLHSLVNSS